MGPVLLALVLSAPYPPELGEPYDGAWVNGGGLYFWWNDWQDDAGVGPGSSRIELRMFDGGYGAFNDTQPWSRGRYTTVTIPNENETWCWRVVNINEAGEESAPSLERCFRTDNSPPTSPSFVDAGVIISTGRVVIEHTAATDSVSGVAGYILALAPNPVSMNFYEHSPREPGVPLVTYVGEGTWYGWIKVEDFASNSNESMRGEYAIPITVTAVDSGFVPAAPAFWDPVTNGYGSGLQWDAGDFSSNGVTHVVASFCKLETGCIWQHGFVGLTASQDSTWLQLGDEGTMVARVAVVINGTVGPWSVPSAPILVDRTAPPRPNNVAVIPSVTNTGPFTVSWYAPADELSGLRDAVIEEHDRGRNITRNIEVSVPAATAMLTPMLDGVYEYRVRSRDSAGNQSDPSLPMVSTMIDRRGPHSFAPVATAVAADGGASVDLSWMLPTDELSGTAMQVLRENAIDGGAELIPVTGSTHRRFVLPGRWTWQTRATDNAGNLGDPSPLSNVVEVTATGVAQGPSILTNGPFSLQCGMPFVTTLQGAGDAPLSWHLVSGPPGLTLVNELIAWIPPAGMSGSFNVNVSLQNGVDTASKTLVFDVSCATATDGGASQDGGTSRARWNLRVAGCACDTTDGFSLMVFAAFALLRRRER